MDARILHLHVLHLSTLYPDWLSDSLSRMVRIAEKFYPVKIFSGYSVNSAQWYLFSQTA